MRSVSTEQYLHAISLHGVSKNFHRNIPPALSHIDANIKRNCITGLVGPDGAGKTTLMRIIAGLLLPTQGQLCVRPFVATPQTDIVYGAIENNPAHALHDVLGYMPQKFGLYEDLTVIENLNLYADLRAVLGEERRKIFEQLLHFTNLAGFTTRPAGKLSGGMKQKLGLACVLLGRPRILLLDEPSVGVDPISRRELWQMMQALISDEVTVMWSTSYLDEAELCEEVLLMNQGKLVYAGPPKKLTEKITGRSVQVRHITGNHRQVLKRALRSEAVMDGVIQGKNIRLLLKDEKNLPVLSELQAGTDVSLIQVPPRFEDAFIDILGGGPGGDSALISVMQNAEIKNDSKEVIIATNLTKKFGSFVAVNNINFSIKRGEIFGLLGPNGAGKSTTFKIMCGLLAPTSGTIHIAGIDLQKDAQQARQQLGYMAQKFSLYGDLTVQQNLQFFSGIYGLTGRIQTNKISAMIDVFELGSLLQTPANELPLGFKQRLALACAIMHDPAILFLDEPTSGVDPITRREFWTHINGLVEKGITIVVSTHFMDEAEYCDRIGLVYRGELIVTGTPDQLKTLAITADNLDPTMEDTFVSLILQRVPKTLNPLPCSIAASETSSDLRLGGVRRMRRTLLSWMTKAGLYVASFDTGIVSSNIKSAILSPDNPPSRKDSKLLGTAIKHDEENNRNFPGGYSPTDLSSTKKRDSRLLRNDNEECPVTKNESIRRWMALCKKEFYQIIRDPSSILIAFVLPIVMLFIYGFGLNLDASKIRLGIVVDDANVETRELASTFSASPFITVLPLTTREAAKKQLTAGHIRGFVSIQSDFSKHLNTLENTASIQVVTDGSEPNTASFSAVYATGAWKTWQHAHDVESGRPAGNSISVEPRFWFNAAAISRYFLIPGSIAIIMTVIGALLTSMVVAREWERGTMEALLSTPVRRMELFFSKLAPYYLLGIASMGLCLLIAVTVLGVPFRGSLFLLFIQTSLFLGGALGLGLLLSTATRNQFNAAQAALNIAFLPAVMLSGFVYEISSMPVVVQGITYIFPARYFVTSLQTLFLSGRVGILLWEDALFLLVAAVVFLGLTAKLMRRRLE